MKVILFKIYKQLLKAETALLVVLLLFMITMAVVQIVMRNFFTSGIIWGDSFLRIIVLWLALVGAMVASRSGKHIAIDVFIHYLNEKQRRFARRITDVFTASICFIMMYYSYAFVIMEYQDQGIAFASVPSWVCEAIIPFAFLMIGLRYFCSAFLKKRN